MKKIKIEELKEKLYLGEFGEYITDYDNGYICDIITEIADNNIDIYNYNLLKWAVDNYEYIEQAIDEFGVATNSKGQADFIHTIMSAQFIYNEQDLRENLESIILFKIYDYIQKTLEVEEITEEQQEQIDLLDFDDNNNLLENILEEVKQILEV